VSIPHIEWFECRGDEGLLAKTDAGDGTVFLAVDFHAVELVHWVELCDLEFFSESGLDFNRTCGSVIVFNIEMLPK
jgi:hypothetical protein